jgi:hypothetical protein
MGVRDYLARFHGNAHVPAPPRNRPNPRTATAWIMTRPGDLDPAGKASLDAILGIRFLCQDFRCG